jgi:hypothetical protein
MSYSAPLAAPATFRDQKEAVDSTSDEKHFESVVMFPWQDPNFNVFADSMRETESAYDDAVYDDDDLLSMMLTFDFMSSQES